MNRTTRIFIFLAAVAVLGGCSGDDPMGAAVMPSPQLSTQQYSVSGTGELTGLVEIGTIFFSSDVFHFRGNVNGWAFHGDIEGTGQFVLGGNWNSDANGNLWAPFYIDATWNGLSGRFTGTIASSVHEAWISSTFVGHGEGELEGIEWRASLEGPLAGAFTYGGTVIVH